MAISNHLGWIARAAATTLLLVVASTFPEFVTAQNAGGSTARPFQPTTAQLTDLDRRIRADMAEYNIPGVVVDVASRTTKRSRPTRPTASASPPKRSFG